MKSKEILKGIDAFNKNIERLFKSELKELDKEIKGRKKWIDKEKKRLDFISTRPNVEEYDHGDGFIGDSEARIYKLQSRKEKILSQKIVPTEEQIYLLNKYEDIIGDSFPEGITKDPNQFLSCLVHFIKKAKEKEGE